MNRDRLIRTLRRHEGAVPHAYRDHLGYLTIGVDRLIDERKGGGLSEAEIDLLLSNDIDRKLAAALEYPWFLGLNAARQEVVVNMIFQLGTGGFSKFRGTHDAIARGDFAAARRRMLDSLWARQTPARAQELAAVMERGDW